MTNYDEGKRDRTEDAEKALGALLIGALLFGSYHLGYSIRSWMYRERPTVEAKETEEPNIPRWESTDIGTTRTGESGMKKILEYSELSQSLHP